MFHSKAFVVLKREGTKLFLHILLQMVPKKNASFKITYLPWLQWKMMQFWNLLIDRQGLVKNLKTWWALGENLMNFQYRVKPWRESWWISNSWWISKTWWTPGDIQNVVKTWWISKPGENVGECENLVSFPVFTKQTKEAFCALKDSETLVAFKFVAFQKYQISNLTSHAGFVPTYIPCLVQDRE